jgi:small subunit ribosomal protein S10
MSFQQSILLKLKAFDSRVLDKAVNEIVNTISKIGLKYKGPVPMPRKISRFTVNRSPHVHKKSREQFEIRDHSRFLIIKASPHNIDSLKTLDIATGVDISIKMRGNKNAKK